MARRCYHHYDDETKTRYHIPGCWGAAVHGIDHCTCYPKKEPSEESLRKDTIRELEKENAKLRRLVEKLSNRKIN